MWKTCVVDVMVTMHHGIMVDEYSVLTSGWVVCLFIIEMTSYVKYAPSISDFQVAGKKSKTFWGGG